MSSARAPALAVEGLTTEFRIEGRWHTAIRDVSFAVDRNETLALVGESGCGKSITALSIMGLVPKANGRISAGRVLLDGRDLTRFDDYPHHFSGGTRQRVMIAMALACSPQVILADEPTTALDVTIQAQVLALLAELKAETGMAMIFITHNLGVVASIADRVAVMYAGDIIETAEVGTLFEHPTHPYTEALLSSIPRVDRDASDLKPIAGQVPPITSMPSGCRYADRCPLRVARCATMPPLVALADDPDHQVRCWVRAGDGGLTT